MNKFKRIAIIGGSGFVGLRLATELTRRGYATRVLTRRRERNRALLVLPTCEVVQARIHDPHVLDATLAGCDAAVNLAGILNETASAGESFENVHVELSRALVSACRENGIQRLLHMSACNANRDGPSLYLSTKYAGELAAFDGAQGGIAVTCFRPSVIFGPGDSFFNRFATLLRFSPGMLPLACPDARMAPVHVEDVVSAFVQSLEDESTHGCGYDLGGPQSYSLRELVEFTAKVTGVDRDVLALSDGLSRLQAMVFGEIPGKPFSMDNYRSLQVDAVCQGDNGLDAFDITPASIETEVPRYLGEDNREGRNARFRSTAAR